MAEWTIVRKRAIAVAGAAGIALMSAALMATPASADSDDIDVTKTASAATAGAGDTVTYSVDIEHVGGLLATDNNVVVTDTLPAHMTYVPGSSTATYFNYLGHIAAHGFNTANYAGGSGWSGGWTETNDDGTATGGGVRIASTALRLRDDSSIAGMPAITREVAVPAGTTVTNANVTFGVIPLAVEADDAFAVEISTDGGSSWSTLGSWTGASVPLVVNVSATSLGASTLSVRFSILSGTDGSDTTCLPPPLSFICSTIDERFSLTGLAVSLDTEQSGLDVGDPTTGIADASWDIGLNDTLTVTYDAVIDSVIPNDTVLLTNTATVTSDDDLVGEVTTSDVELVRSPDLDVVLTGNGPHHVGTPLVVTATVYHSTASDGAPVCQFELHGGSSAPTAFTYGSGDTDTDGCLDYGETWTLTKAFAGLTGTSGDHSMPLAATGYGPILSGGVAVFDADFEQPEEFVYTVVLADSGPRDATGALVVALGLISAGAALLFVGSRRRVA